MRRRTSRDGIDAYHVVVDTRIIIPYNANHIMRVSAINEKGMVDERRIELLCR